jgi:hypothetical protein
MASRRLATPSVAIVSLVPLTVMTAASAVCDKSEKNKAIKPARPETRRVLFCLTENAEHLKPMFGISNPSFDFTRPGGDFL